MLEFVDVHAGYGPVRALSGVSLRVGGGSAVGLLGRNGAGKTTVLRVASAMIAARGGEVRFDGARLGRTTPEQLVARGLVHVPEGRALFAGMTAAENLELGAHSLRISRRATKASIEQVLDYFPALRRKLGQSAGSMSGGEQQMLVIGRALMARPRLLLLDEPSFGLSPVVCEELYATLARLVAEGLSLLIVEQYVDLLAGVADWIYLLDKGRVSAAGPPAETLTGSVLEQSYLADTVEASR